MQRKSKLTIAIATALFAALGGMAVYAQDKYALKSPDGIAFSDFKGYEDWAVVSSARTDEVLKVIVADPEVIEEWKWRGVPVWEHDGIICTGETYKSVVKLTFAKGASLDDPSRLFNSSLDGNVRRAIDIHEGDTINEKALKALIRAAIALNTSARAAARPVRAQKKSQSA